MTEQHNSVIDTNYFCHYVRCLEQMLGITLNCHVSKALVCAEYSYPKGSPNTNS
jgi:hypothetical protein